MKKAVRVLVQLDETDYAKLVKQLDISVAQFFRDAVQEKLTGIDSAVQVKANDLARTFITK